MPGGSGCEGRSGFLEGSSGDISGSLYGGYSSGVPEGCMSGGCCGTGISEGIFLGDMVLFYPYR